MDTNRILRLHGFNDHPNFVDIARWAARFADCNPNTTEENLLVQVRLQFGRALEKLAMGAKANPFNVYGEVGTDIDHDAVEQMYTAMRLPVAVQGAMMPDAHRGYALPIGGVVALQDAISPSFVGYDIACRMSLTILDISPEDFMSNRVALADALLHSTEFGKGANTDGECDHDVMYDERWETIDACARLKPLAQNQLGSSGGGNHFADLVVGKVIVSDDGWLTGVPDKFVALMTHSGSRGTGHKLATHYCKLAEAETRATTRGVPRDYAWLSMSHDAGREYFAAMNLMGEYAKANHDNIHRRFMSRAGISQLAHFENHHNFAWKRPGFDQYIHRKGATPAGFGVPAIIPGTSGSTSYLCVGLGNEGSLLSASHGAGRPFSRTEAKRRHNSVFVEQWYEEHDVMTFGLAPDETVLAYKDIDHVMELQSELVRPVATMQPKVVVMGGGKADDGD